jgi:predicted transcriptional regulator
MKPEAALSAFAEVWRQAESGGEPVPRLAFASLREVFSAVTEKRLELLRHVAAHEGLNVRQVTRELGRDYKNVHTDVKVFLDLGLLEKGEEGGLPAPFDEIVIHAEIRDAA